MKRKYQILGFILLLICSIIYDFQKPVEINKEKQEEMSYVILEGAFLKQGKYQFKGKKTVQQIIDDVGIENQANLKALSLDMIVQDESTLYLPLKSKHCISLNHASSQQLMTLERVGKKTALKIIEYRQKHPFQRLEEIMNIQGIGEKTYQRLREHLCL
jgi:competence protein ComEA